MSAHVIVLAGSWMTMLHGTTIVVLLIVTVPPRRLAWATSGHALLSSLTVASWMKPGLVEAVDAGRGDAEQRVGERRRDERRRGADGGLAVPPPPLPKATAAPATRMASPRTTAIAIRAHPFSLRFLLLISAFPRVVRL